MAALLSDRGGGGPSAPLSLGSLKAIAGHAEPGAGLAGGLKLLLQLQAGEASPNAQLRTLNRLVGASVYADLPGICMWTCHPTAVPLSTAGVGRVGGVSSFGYAGTIAHAAQSVVGRDDKGPLAGSNAALHDRSHTKSTALVGNMWPALLPVVRRRAFPWRCIPTPLASSSLECGGSHSVVTRTNDLPVAEALSRPRPLRDMAAGEEPMRNFYSFPDGRVEFWASWTLASRRRIVAARRGD